MKPDECVDQTQSLNRRRFLKRSGSTITITTLASAITTRAYAQENNEIKIALIGCGGRGTGAASQALSTSDQGPVKLWAMADVFKDRLKSSFRRLSKRHEEQIDVPEERRFLGFDAYKQAIDAVGEGGVVLLTTPPTFRPPHLEYAVEKGRHVFMEKSFAVDAPGIRRVLAAGKKADEKNLKIAGGLMCRHSLPTEMAVQQIHDGAIGPVITAMAYRLHGPVKYYQRREGESELAHQIRNYSSFTWTNGSFVNDWLIHNIDVCCWVKDAWPVAVQGQGGRQVRSKADQLYDHWALDYEFSDGTRLIAQGRHMLKTYGRFCCNIFGAKGFAKLGEHIGRPSLYDAHLEDRDRLVWQYKQRAKSQYQREHDLLFEAIRNNKPYNETERCAKAAMTTILGRMAGESGKRITWEEGLHSDLSLADVDAMTWQSEAPVQPDSEGHYTIAMPGITKTV